MLQTSLKTHAATETSGLPSLREDIGGILKFLSKPKRQLRLQDCPRFARASGVSTLKQMPGLRPLSFFIAVALKNKFSSLHQ
jgi:hypothetical protein